MHLGERRTSRSRPVTAQAEIAPNSQLPAFKSRKCEIDKRSRPLLKSETLEAGMASFSWPPIDSFRRTFLQTEPLGLRRRPSKQCHSPFFANDNFQAVSQPRADTPARLFALTRLFIYCLGQQARAVIGTSSYGSSSFFFSLVEFIEGNPAATVDCSTFACWPSG